MLVASAGLYFHQTQEFLTKFPEINKLLTSDLWKDKYVFKDVKLVINNHENTSAGILDDRGMLNVTGWTYANKMNAKKRKVNIFFGSRKISQNRNILSDKKIRSRL